LKTEYTEQHTEYTEQHTEYTEQHTEYTEQHTVTHSSLILFSLPLPYRLISRKVLAQQPRLPSKPRMPETSRNSNYFKPREEPQGFWLRSQEFESNLSLVSVKVTKQRVA